MKQQKNENYLDTTLYQVAYWWLCHKKMKLTTANLFKTMHRISQKIDRINKNSKKKLIDFTDGHCILRDV